MDRIRSERPVKTSWSWLLNNRDGLLDLKLVQPDRLITRRNHAGMKVFHLGGGCLQTPVHAYVHDAYHPRPGQLGEGKSGSGTLVRWIERGAAADRATVHAIIVDDPGAIGDWHLKQEEGCAAVIEGPSRTQVWKLSVNDSEITLCDGIRNRRYAVVRNFENQWKLKAS